MSSMDKPTWKIIAHDNYDRDNHSEWVAAEHIYSERAAEIMCKALNDAEPERSDWYFHVKPGDYKLYIWEP